MIEDPSIQLSAKKKILHQGSRTSPIKKKEKKKKVKGTKRARHSRGPKEGEFHMPSAAEAHARAPAPGPSG